MAAYAKKMFGMFDGEEHFKVVTKVAASNHFIHWVMALGSGAKITAPENLVKEVKEEIQRLSAQYTK